MRDVVYADELLDDLEKVLYTVNVDYYIAKARKLSAKDLIEELVSRYEEQIEDKDKEIEKLRAKAGKYVSECARLNEERIQAQMAEAVLRRKLKNICEEDLRDDCNYL